jgi:hypothetical protein
VGGAYLPGGVCSGCLIVCAFGFVRVEVGCSGVGWLFGCGAVCCFGCGFEAWVGSVGVCSGGLVVVVCAFGCVRFELVRLVFRVCFGVAGSVVWVVSIYPVGSVRGV